MNTVRLQNASDSNNRSRRLRNGKTYSISPATARSYEEPGKLVGRFFELAVRNCLAVHGYGDPFGLPLRLHGNPIL
jgi:hypothetical protein